MDLLILLCLLLVRVCLVCLLHVVVVILNACIHVPTIGTPLSRGGAEVGITLRSSLADAMVESVAVVVMNLVRPRRFARSRFLSLCAGLNEKPLRGFRASARGRAQAPR